MRRSLGHQQQCYGNGNANGYDGMWVKSQDQMQGYDVHGEPGQSNNPGMNMRRGGGGYVDSEYSKVHPATFGGRGSHGQLQQGWHGGNGSNKWHNPSVPHQHQHGNGGKFNSHSNSNYGAHYEYVSEDGVDFESYSSEAHSYPGVTVRVEEMRHEHHNLGRNMNLNPNAARKVLWLA